MWAIVAMLVALAGAAAAQAGPQGLRTGDEAAGWEGVGRLDIDGKGFCTAALIAPDLVLTAAHCLFDRASGARVAPERMVFLAGLRNGRAAASRDVRRAVPHPLYVFDPAQGALGSAHDLALLELAQPIRPADVAYFETGGPVAAGMVVDVVSYAADRSEVPALERVCGILGQEAGVLVMTCEVDFGSSGAPVFATTGGVRRIVSVVSAKGELGAEPVSLGAPVAGPLEDLRAALAEEGALPQIRSLGAGERAETGARFVGVGE